MAIKLPIRGMPEWLTSITPEAMATDRFPLSDVLQDSLYYPASGFDGDPIRYLAGHVHSFVYVDYGYTRADLDRALSERGVRGYHLLERRMLSQQDLAPHGWTPSGPTRKDGDPAKRRDWIKAPFCDWLVFERNTDLPPDHGPVRFSLLYLCADGVLAFQALYTANGLVPLIVAIIQPGTGFGGNWTDFRDEDASLARAVLSNPAGQPAVLLHGGIGSASSYEEPIWSGYNEQIGSTTKTGGGAIVAWTKGEGDDECASAFAGIGNRDN